MPSTATPLGSVMTCCTPLTAFAAASLMALGLAPIAGARDITATSMPGTWASMPKRALPLLLAALSRRLVGLPMMVKFLLSFSLGLVGTGSLAAASASAP